MPPATAVGTSADRGWRNGEASGNDADVKSQVPDRDGEICCAECKHARKIDGVNPTETVKRCQCPRAPSVITTSFTLARGINPLTDVRSEFGDRDIRPANDIKTMHQT